MRKKPVISSILCAVCLFMLSSLSVFAEGDGSGSGQNRNIPLALERCSVSDGQTNVSVDETIQLDFNKNICNITVLSNNKTCFHLTDANGDPVSIDLIFPDDQVQRDYRRQVFIRPVSDLQENAPYRLTVDKGLTAKNGTLLSSACSISFTTGSGRSGEENQILKALGQNRIAYETAYEETADSVPVNKEGLDDPAPEEKADTGFLAKIGAAILILLIVGFTVVLRLSKARSSKDKKE